MNWRQTIITCSAAVSYACILSLSPAYADDAAKCDGVDPEMIERSLADSRDVVAVNELKMRQGKQGLWTVVGAEILFLAEQGDTQAWLDRVGRCKIASLSNKSAAAAKAFAGAKLSIYQAGPNFVARITSDNAQKAKEISKMAQDLMTKHDKKK
jgi:hypothetical protein